ncbi:hypothetical protein [Aliamphritea spongicola]|nr:hypothetical protein [Aliamphritea spongicola]
MTTLIKNARIVNEGEVREADLRIDGQRIDLIGKDIPARPSETIIDAQGRWLLPGMIDDQVHFREPDSPTKEALPVNHGLLSPVALQAIWKCPT